MNILFFDVVPTNIVRFFEDVVSVLEEQRHAKSFFVVEEDDHNDLSYVRDAYPNAARIEYVQRRNVRWFKDYLVSNDIDAVFINAQRIPDDLVVFCARDSGVPVFMIQHGMYIPFMKRGGSFFLKKLGKTLRFARYAAATSKAVTGSRLSVLWRYIAAYVFGFNQVSLGIPREQLNAHRVYVYGDHWKDFHHSQFGYSYDAQLTVGYPDLMNVGNIRQSPKMPNSVCYVAQTLVEDGRLARSTQLRFFSELVDACEATGRSLIVKLHPRSDLGLFDASSGRENVTLVTDELPHVEKYIGHYSTLIVKGFQLSGDVFIWEYVGHPTPDYFSGLAGVVSRDVDALKSWLGSAARKEALIDTYFFENPDVFNDLAADFSRVMADVQVQSQTPR